MKQCKACPWKKSTSPEKDIPGGYSEEQHEALSCTIARPGDMSGVGRAMHVMACHETTPGKERHCVGWTLHQLGPGNNLALRMRAMSDPSFREAVGKMTLDGPQHERLEDTMPKKRRRARRERHA